MTSIDSIQIYSDGEIEAAMDRYSLGHKTKSRRESLKTQLTMQYGTKYRDPENTRELMGKLQPLGKAFAIIAVCMFGPNLPSENGRHTDRKIIWRSAAQYCMTEDTIELILEREKGEPKLVEMNMKSLLNAALISVRTDLPNAARSYAAYAQTFVFAVVRQDAETQRHLGLEMNQSVMEQ